MFVLYQSPASYHVHIPGVQNTLADTISRNNQTLLFSQVPDAANPTIVAGGVGRPTARLDVSTLVPVVQELFVTGLAPATRRAYQSGTNRYRRFCSVYGVSPFPVSEQNLSFFVSILHRDGLSGATVKGYLAAVRHAQIALGMGDPRISSMPQLEYVVRGARKKAAGRPSRTRLPITPPILRQLKSVWERDPNRFDAAMLWAAPCMCFFGFLRSGEVVVPSDRGFDPSVHLGYGDVRADSRARPQFVEVRIKASKTDPFREGVSIYLGVTGLDLCTVAAILSFMVRRGSSAGALFIFSDGR